MIVPTFKDPATRELFERSGFAVFPGFAKSLVPDLVATYRAMLAELPASDPYFKAPMTGTNCIADMELRARILAAVGRIVEPGMHAILDDFRLVGAGFRVKQAGPDSTLPLHQDPTQVEEDRHWLMNFIIPIVDTSPENGALQVVPGSHNIMPTLRSLDLEDRAETWNLDEVIEPLTETIPMRAGDAIFYPQSLLHGSGPNLTTEDRPLILGTLVAREAPVTVYFRKPDEARVFECYEVPDDYYNRMENFDRDHKLRPTVGRRLADVEDPYNRSRDEIMAAFRALSR